MSLTPLLALVLACAHTPRELEPSRGLVGIRYRALPEGLLVTQVLPGTSAATAGMGVGDLIIAVDRARVPEVPPEQLGAALAGPPGASLRLELLGPLGAPARALSLVRGARERPEADEDSPEILALRQALSRGQVARAEQAARALVAVDFAGERPGRAAARALRGEGRAHPEAAAAAGRILAEALTADIDIQFLAAEAAYRAGAYAEAVARLLTVERLRPPDLRGPGAGEDALRGDAGGDPWGRTMLARALSALGQQEEAANVARALARTRDTGSLLAELGLRRLEAGEPWRARVAPLPEIELALLDGSRWLLSEQRGKPVLVNFWASWCGPCMQELPELQAMWERRAAEGLSVLAISVDDPGDRDAAERTIRKLGLTLPVAHAPELMDRFAVGPIPSARLLGKEGALRFVDEGYSPDGLARMEAQIDRAMAESLEDGATLGMAWTRGSARLAGFLTLAGADDLAVDEGGALVGVADHVPVRVIPGPDGLMAALPSPAPPGGSSAERVAWLGGPVVASVDEPWLRARGPAGEPRWMLTTPGPVRDLAVQGDALWVATDAEILVLDAAGSVVRRLPGGAVDLATAEGGLWAVDGAHQRWLSQDPSSGPAVERLAPDGACALADGGVASLLARSCVAGRFGADGGMRSVIARDDGMIVGLDAAGQPAFTLSLQTESRLAALDLDGDGRDTLLVSIHGQGLAWIDLTLP